MSLDLSKLFGYIVDGFNKLLQFIYDVLMHATGYVVQMLLDGVLAFLNWLPVPDFVTTAVTSVQGVGSLSGGVLYFLNLFDVGFGFEVIFGALVARWLLRRIPVIG